MSYQSPVDGDGVDVWNSGLLCYNPKKTLLNSVAVKASKTCVGISVTFLSYFVYCNSTLKVPEPSM